jgi:hypothetical protein
MKNHLQPNLFCVVLGVQLIEGGTEQLSAGLHAAAAGLKFLQPLKNRNNGIFQFDVLTHR